MSHFRKNAEAGRLPIAFLINKASPVFRAGTWRGPAGLRQMKPAPLLLDGSINNL